MTTATQDGRRLRSVRSRDAIVEAFLQLVRSGDDKPSSLDIAARAGVTQRTLFNQFRDVSQLLEAAVERQVAHVRSILPDVPARGSLRTRIDRYVDGLSRVLDGVAEVRWAVLRHPGASPQLARGIASVRAETRRRLEALLEPATACLDDAARAELLDAAEVATDPMTWRTLRRQLGLSRAAAAAVMRRTLLALATVEAS